MKYKVSRYDVLVSDQYDIQDLDFILAKDDRKIIHGTVWDEDDEPNRVAGAVVRLYLPGPKYHTEDPNDLIPVGYTVTDENGEFFAGPFKQGTSLIIKIFKTETSNFSGVRPRRPMYDNTKNEEENAYKAPGKDVVEEYGAYSGRAEILHVMFNKKDKN